jgi:predicted Zn finger-like uncharacterized protein
MDGLRLSCPDCASVLRLAASAAGKRVRCPKCGGTLDVPRPRPGGVATPPELPQASPDNSPAYAHRKTAAPTFEDEDRPHPPRKARREPRARRGTPVGLIIGLCVFAGIVLVGGTIALVLALRPQANTTTANIPTAGAVPAAPLPLPAIGLTSWQPDPALLGDLDAPTMVQGYRLRPPRGLLHLDQKTSAGRADIWTNEDRGAAERLTTFSTIIATDQPIELVSNVPGFLTGYFNSLKRKAKDLQEGPHERGLIGGVTFTRVAWTATETALNRPTHGFVYVGVRRSHRIVLTGLEHVGEPSVLPLFDTAARTFAP